MTKKLILIIFAVALLSSAATYATTAYLPWTKNIYSISDDEEVDCGGSLCHERTVSMFDYGDDRCYVTREGISCVKRGER